MDPVLQVVLLALLFAGSHVVLATAPVRGRLVAAFGERGFRAVFFTVAAASFALLAVIYADHRHDGPRGPALGTAPIVGWLLGACVVAGVALMVASFWTYTGGPYDTAQPRCRGPRGLERVTRHPFMVGMALFAGAHALLATRLTAAVLMLALAALATLGTRHQDAKLRRLRGPSFGAYLEATSALPFAAIAAGRQRLVWHELPLTGLAIGLAAAAALRWAHADLFAHRGAWVVLVTVGGALVILAASARRRPLGTAARR
jgi:uncharacterized membrane protein